MAVDVIVITGSMGSGKTTVLGEASDLLTAAGVLHAGIDLDGLSIGLVPEGIWPVLAHWNLASVWQNFARAGAARLLLAAAVESRADLERICDAIPDADIIVCRLKAALSTMQQRVGAREPGMLQQTFVARVGELEAILDRAQLEDFVLVNDGVLVTDVAREMLVRADWLS